MKSLRELREELTGIRLAAADTSLWSVAATVNQRALAAINDAIATYEFRSRVLYNSAAAPEGVGFFTVPKNIKSIQSIYAAGDTSSQPREVREWAHIPTAATNLVRIGVNYAGKILQITGEAALEQFPADVALAGAVSNTVKALSVTGGSPAAYWPSPGYFEISSPANVTIAALGGTAGREVVHYELALPQGFTNLIRGVVGEAQAWSSGAVVSAVAVVPDNAQAVILKAAEANMYEFWTAHRSQYTQYTAAMGIQSLGVEDILALAQTLQAEAARRYRAIRKAPAPGRIALKKPRTT